MFKTTSSETNSLDIVKINNTEELTRFIWDFVEENSQSRNVNVKSDWEAASPEKVSLETLGTIRQKLSRFISESGRHHHQQYPIPKAIRDNIETEEDIRNQVSLIVSEQENLYNEETNNLEQQVKIIQDQLTNTDTEEEEQEKEEVVAVYVNGDLISQAEVVTESVIIGPENKVTWTRSNPKTPNSQMSSSDYLYDEYQEYGDSEDSGSFPSPSLLQPPHIAGSSALSSLDSLFAEHLPGHLNTDLPLHLISKLQNSPVSLPESETLNILLTPPTSNSKHPNIAILPTHDLAGFSSNISQDIGVDIEAILSSLAGSASKLRNKPMIVEENHTQLIKQAGRPTKLKIKETMSEILGDSNNPQINVLKNKEEENSFSDLESLILGVTGDSMPNLSQDMPKGNLEDQLKLNVTTKTNIVNIFAFNIYPSASPQTGEKYQVNDFSSLGTSINTEAAVMFQAPGGAGPTHIQSHYDFQSQPAPSPAPPGKKTIDAVLGAVLLSQLEGGGSDRVIQALGQNPAMMTALLESSPGPPPGSPGTEAGGQLGGQSQGLYGAGVDNLSEYAPGPYGLIARNNAIEKLIFAMTRAETSQATPGSGEDYSQFLAEMPDYAKLLLNKNNNIHQPQYQQYQQPSRERADDLGPLGPLGYSLTATDQKVKPAVPVPPQDFLQSVGGSAAVAALAGAVVTYPYWLPLLAGRRRRRRRRKRFVQQRLSRDGNPEISTDWLALLTGSKYDRTENIDHRLGNWLNSTADTNLQSLQEYAGTAASNRILRPKIKEKVRVDLSPAKKEEIQEWRESYQNNISTEEAGDDQDRKPELYTNYYPVISNTTTTTTTTSTTTTSTTTTTTTTTSSTRTTPRTKTTTAPSSKETLPNSLLFWTTARPYRPFRKTTMKTTTTSQSPPTTTSAILPSIPTSEKVSGGRRSTSGFMWSS